jgi:undecaprenyl-diphosphatase
MLRPDRSSYVRALITLDVAATERANRAVARPGVCALFRAISRLGDGVLWYSMMALALAVHGTGAVVPVAHMLVVGAVGLALYRLLKRSTARPRPYQVHSAIRCAADPLDPFSFPSGHTLHAVAFATLFAWYYPLTAPYVLAFAALVAASRLVLGLHYPSDVLAGAAIGASLAAGSLALVPGS